MHVPYARAMIRSGRASFTVLSTETDAARISEILGVAPTNVDPRGSVRRSGRVRDQNVWRIDVGRVANTEDDQTGTSALTALLDRIRPAAGSVGRLPADCDARIRWSAESDSAQGGFVIPSELASDIAALGVDVYAMVFLGEDDDED